VDRRDARKRYEPLFREFMAAFPRKVDHQRAFDVFIDLMLDGEQPELIIERAASYSANVDPDQLQYVPSPRSWLRDRRWNDEDIFTDKKVSTREWFVRAWKDGDVGAVQNKYGFIYPDPPIPPGVTDVSAYRKDDRTRWVAQIASHVLNQTPLPD
jgi:hypothetical protein